MAGRTDTMMDASEVAAMARLLEIRSRQLVRSHIAGLYTSAFRGPGLDFAGFRPYEPGDEIRRIDWNVTARTGRPHVRCFQEEREQIVYVALDVSASMEFASSWRSKLQLAREVGAVLAMAALAGGDRAGLLLFRTGSVRHVAARKGRNQGLKILRCMLQAAPALRPAPLAWHLLMARLPERAVIFLISDFIPAPTPGHLAAVAHGRDLVPLWIYDRLERSLPRTGIVPAADSESPASGWLPALSARRLNAINERLHRHAESLRDLFRSLRLDFAGLAAHRNFIDPLRRLMARRLQRQSR